MKLAIAACATSAMAMRVGATALRDAEFDAFCTKFDKNYDDAGEYARRLKIFRDKKAMVEQHNIRSDAQLASLPEGSSPFRRGLNQFSDLTDAEFKKFFGLKKSALPQRNSAATTLQQQQQQQLSARVLPPAWDWRHKGAVTKPRNQGNCGSCWAFAGTEAIESALYLGGGKLVDLSPQAFSDCVPNPKHCGGTGGCEGATYDLLFSYANSTHGAVLESDYKYVGKDQPCKISSVKPAAAVTGWVDVSSNNYTALEQAIYHTPTAVGVAAMNWGDYMGGVYPNELCSGDIDHAVLAVGWGTDPGLGDYWLIKNSWGADWGENGYIRLQKNKDFCTQDSSPSDGLGCAGGPAKVKVCGACAIQYAPAYPTGVTASP